ncbi:hypothetical protein PVAP13_6NG102015 [Panicum virgatum]|uniref:Uncharacterized protein n=1 Tax=Panicum virgatum TaxID=38727 RepID=A0A8T0QWV6_PANVG|nr:hypothetical protein PVAP13_6NG102015 [Panicum virgatum]
MDQRGFTVLLEVYAIMLLCLFLHGSCVVLTNVENQAAVLCIWFVVPCSISVG